jgi:PDZ domain-containing protein
VTTIEPMLQERPGEGPPRGRRRTRRLWIVLLVVAVLLGGGYIAADRYTSHLYALAPGSASPVGPAITVKPPTPTYTHPGRILFVTVSLRTVGPIDYVFDKINPNVQLVNQSALVGPSRPSQLNQVDAVQMQTSTQTAVIVALRQLGYTVVVHDIGAEVNVVSAKSPADGHLVPGDVITAVDGAPTTTSDALVAIIHAHKPGDELDFTVQPPTGPVRTERITLGTTPPGVSPTPRAFLGVQTSTKQQAILPVNVTIDPGNVGGPSAGLAFTLGVINELQSGDVTGGHTVAITGTINPDGTVGDVGGVAQKTVAVRRTAAIAFLVPPGEYNVARQHAGSRLKIIEVRSVQDALNALASLGGDVSGATPAHAAAA